MKIENPEKYFLTTEQRKEIEKEIEFWKSEEKRLNAPCLYLLKQTNLQNKLNWDDYLKNGCQYSKEDKKIFDKINNGG